MCLCSAYMLPCCHHKIPHLLFQFFILFKNVCIICSLRAIFYRFVLRTSELIVTFMTTTRIHSVIWIGEEWKLKILAFPLFSVYVSFIFISINFPVFPSSLFSPESQRRNNAIKINSQQRHANNNKMRKKAKRVLNIFMIIMEIYQKRLPSSRLHCPAQSHMIEMRVGVCKAV